MHKFPNALTLQLVFCLSMASPCLRLSAATPYSPQSPEPFGELWRWTQIDALRPWYFSCGDTDPTGRHWMAHTHGAVCYDGITAKRFPLPKAWELKGTAIDIHLGKNGEAYLLYPKFLCVLKTNGQWHRLLETDENGLQATSITETADGTIWVALQKGLYKIRDGQAEAVPCNLKSLSAIIADDQSRLWCIGNSPQELAVYETTASCRELKLVRQEDLGSYQTDSAFKLYKKSTGEIWAILEQSERRLAIKLQNGFETQEVPLPPGSDRFSRIDHFSALKDGSFIYFQQPKISIYRDGSWTTIHRKNYPLPITGPRLIELSEQRILLCGWMSRPFIIDLSTKRWTSYQNLIFGDDSQTHDWFIHRDNRIVSRERQTESWVAHDCDGSIQKPNAIFCDDEGVVWVSGGHHGMAAVSYLSNGQWTREVFPHVGFTFGPLAVNQLSDGSMLFGGGRQRNVPKFSGGAVHFKRSPNGFEATSIAPPDIIYDPHAVAESEKHGLFFGKKNLYRKTSIDTPGYKAVESFSNKWIEQLMFDDQQNLWVACSGRGLYRFDGTSWTQFTTDDGLAGMETVYVLNGLIQKGIWAATLNGISRFDGRTWTTKALKESLKFEYKAGSLAESETGALWLNFTESRWILVKQRNQLENDHTHKCVRYLPDNQAPETQLLRYKNRFLESADAYFSWSAQDPWNDTPQNQLEYSYRLSGEEWSPYQQSTDAYLTDLPSGNFTFEVRARDRDWNVDLTPATASFHVVPYLWKRPWYIALVSLTLLALIVLIATVIRQRVRRMIALHDFKIDFFTNLSHELRTPLTVILGPLERLAAKTSDERDKSALDRIARNANKMLGLVNQLLEFRKVELGKLEYSPSPGEIVTFLKDAVYSLEPLWERRKQKVTFTINQRIYRCSYDEDKLIRIIDNLVSNAIKYTPQGGRISIDARIERNNLYLEIQDNGMGIPAEKLEQVMHPFYRVPSNIKEEAGSGIGLSLVKELIELWGGTINMQSPPPGENQGTQIKIALPLKVQTSIDASEELEKTDSEDQQSNEYQTTASPKSQRPRILIVEDNEDLRAHLIDELSESFQVSSASNGHEGMDTIVRSPPDLILSDVMMPKVDGVEFCRRIRENRNTCHIPVILLTAQKAEERYVEGINSGADEYFTKPIKTSKLVHRIRSLLKSRKQLYDLFANQIEIEPRKIAVVSSDQSFLQQALEIMEANMQTENFDVETFAQHMKMSRKTLHRKMKAITGIPPSDFIRTMRLKRAAQLLSTSDLSISEIMTQCGHYEASTFSRAFKKEFNLTPSDYRNQNKK